MVEADEAAGLQVGRQQVGDCWLLLAERKDRQVGAHCGQVGWHLVAGRQADGPPGGSVLQVGGMPGCLLFAERTDRQAGIGLRASGPLLVVAERPGRQGEHAAGKWADVFWMWAGGAMRVDCGPADGSVSWSPSA